MDKSYYFYVLHCKDGTLYAGYTTDLQHRLQVHNDGKGAKYTKPQKRRPVRMIYAERWASKSLAMKQEYGFKQLTRQAKIQYLKAHGQASIHNQQLVIVNQINKGEIQC